jgi:hypothetical protein
MTLRNPFPGEKIIKTNYLYEFFFSDLASKTISESSFLTLDYIDNSYGSFIRERSQLDGEAFSYFMSHIDERKIIQNAIQEYAKKNVHLKPNVRNSITIQAEQIKYTIKRYLLTPITSEDRKRLYQLEKRYGVHPLDDIIGLTGLPFKITVNAMLKISKKAQEARSFQAASQDLRDDCGIKLDACTISDVTSLIGYIVFKSDMERAEENYKLFLDGKLHFPSVKKPGVLYLQADGAMVHTREKKVEDDSDNGWRENKLGIVYDSEHLREVLRTNRHGQIEPQHKILKKEYTSYIGSVTGFKKLFFENACRNGYGIFKDTVMISDGAQWISNMVLDLFPDAVHILDFYHVSEKIWDLGKLHFENDPAACHEWCRRICDAIEASEYQKVRQDIVKIESMVKSARVSTYLDKNLDRIDYKYYHLKKYCIGSGAIEGSNKSVIQRRLKLSGMRWNRAPAQSVATLRCKKDSDRWYIDVVVPVRTKFGLPPVF